MANPRVLFIDDELALVNNLSQLLRLMGYQTGVAIDGEQGLRAIRTGAFDVVVLDMRMPRLSGMGVLRALDGVEGAPEIIVMTGFGTIQNGLESLSHGAFDYVSKPVNIKNLVEKITAAWERKIKRNPAPLSQNGNNSNG